MRILMLCLQPRPTDATIEEVPDPIEHEIFGRWEFSPLAINQEPDTCPYPSWERLDQNWRRGDPALMRLYERIAMAAGEHDVLINWAGWGLHPEFTRFLPCFTVSIFADDPDDSDIVGTQHLVSGYDAVFTNNRGCLDLYRSWGRPDAQWAPILGWPGATSRRWGGGRDVLEGPRDVDLSFIGSLWNTGRSPLLALSKRFPQGRFHGQDWPTGMLPTDELLPLYRRTKIGVNLHRSIGPVNLRTFQLPGNGVMQICDNAPLLAEIFEPGKEVVAVDSTDDIGDLIAYYLAHDEERRSIAAGGWDRWHRDYSFEPGMRRLMERICVMRRGGGGALPGDRRLDVGTADLIRCLMNHAVAGTVAMFGVGSDWRRAATMEPLLRTLVAKGRIRLYDSYRCGEVEGGALIHPPARLSDEDFPIVLTPSATALRAQISYAMVDQGISRKRLVDPYGSRFNAQFQG
ncbi:glycosyltransferase [Azospirillum formosense]|uniref:glycosyltransferase n=1 Tax=Azospirillum formosense TaxID=861533 RepID=UPI00338DC1B1